MKGVLLAFSLLAGIALAGHAMAADSCRLAYKMLPGQLWVSEMSSQYKSSTAGAEAMPATRYSVRYQVSKADKPGWVKLEARILSHSANSEGGLDYTKLTYTADMHSSGELRHITHTGSAMPKLPKEQLAAMPPQYADLMAGQDDMMAKAMQKGVLWFPELPEDKLKVGDSFDVAEKSDLGTNAMAQFQTVIKTEYTLEDVNQGLAYFSVRQHSQTKVSGMGSSSDTLTAGKADAVFDLEQGMWVEMTTKMQISSSSGGVEMGGIQVSRFRMQRQ